MGRMGGRSAGRGARGGSEGEKGRGNDTKAHVLVPSPPALSVLSCGD